MKSFFFSFFSCERHGKKRKGSRVRAQDPRTPENKSESESENVYLSLNEDGDGGDGVPNESEHEDEPKDDHAKT